ncbi:MAG TPA: serine/threonine-protein kinase [Gemmata sp.]|jgi:serine/threonine protein kinase|nr:serine/threonine-protein kinase [Gemmata sp.]
MSSLLAANTVDAAALAEELARFRVIDHTRLTELMSEFTGGNSEALAEYLVHLGALTPFQAERALAGESRTIALGPYRLTGLAGFGTFGRVYTAIRFEKPGEFHICVFPLRSLWRARQAKQIARSFGNILHPAVVPLLDADSSNGFHYLVWPLVEGVPLTDRMSSSEPFSPGEAIGVLAHLADALHACHVRKIVHGAINPHSIVLDRNGLPRLLELGAGAILSSNLTDEESLLDSLSASVASTAILKFSAPEFVEKPVGTPETDQYALGAIGYYILTGEPPFATASLTDWLAAKANGQPYPLAEVTASIPSELVDVIDRMLQTKPENRFSGLDEVQDRLAAIAGCSNPLAQPSEFSPQSLQQEYPLYQTDHAFRLNGNLGWQASGSGIADLPARDDSDASITFELPQPIPDPAPEPESIQNVLKERRLLTGMFEQDDPPSQLVVKPTRPVRQSGPKRDLNQHENDREDNPLSEELKASGDRPLSAQNALQNVANTPASPASRTSPSQSEDLHMAEIQWPDPFDRANDPARFPRAKTPPDPRKGVSTPVHYHTESSEGNIGVSDSGQVAAQPSSGERVADSVLWKKVKRSLLFWQAPQDNLRVSVFGPLSVSSGQPAKLSVFLHTPETTDSVRTLSRAFHHDSELIGSGFVAQEVTRDTELGVHLSMANAGVSKSLMTLTWRGQPHRLVFDLHIPWESPGGPAPGLVSIGRNNIRIGKVEFWLTLLPRKG